MAHEHSRPALIWIPGGTFLMGSDRHYPEEGPVHPVTVEGFWMDRAPVTNAEFARFVEATGHITCAERIPPPEDYPDVPRERLVAGSLVFVKTSHPVALDDPRRWWRYEAGADWRHPEGRGSSLEGRMEHPVVHVALADAEAYARWAGKTLPTEAEWERAARGGLEGAEFAWGDTLAPEGRMLANYWQGRFPWENHAEDGFEGTSPVGTYPPNGYGLVDTIGNVWEWTADDYRPGHHTTKTKSCCLPDHPHSARSRDPTTKARVPRKVLKGGSHLCAANYCQRYRPAARFPEAVDTSTSHLGFRCVRRVT